MSVRTNQPDKPPLRSKVFVIDPHAPARHAFVQLLNNEPDLMVCGEADQAARAILLIAELQPDLVLFDPSLCVAEGVATLRLLTNRWPKLPVLVFSLDNGARYIAQLQKAGARGYISKVDSASNILDAIRRLFHPAPRVTPEADDPDALA